MISSWFLLIVISVFLFAVSTILQRLLLKDDKSDPVAYSIIFQIIVGLIIGVFGFLFGSMNFSNIKPVFFNILLMTLLYILANVFTFKALKKIEASEYTIIFSSRVLFTIIASSIFLREKLTFQQFGGAMLILVAIFLATYNKTKIRFGKGELLALLGAMSIGFETTNDRMILSSMKLYPFVTIAFIVPAIVMLFIFPKSLPKMKIFLDKKLLSRMLTFSFLYAISSITFFAALQIGNNSSQIAVINQTSTIVIVLLGIIFLKERFNIINKLLAAVLSVIGVILTI